ncbi:MAG TPA: aminotransferase class III-fold pyridoxal phosphate-dependent enzyme [Thermomicrobiales bacterium]|nr:aminotransferase class III-fold pyridoxal phosphate-dependent enzyme [Thermomicrobiales bacterium]
MVAEVGLDPQTLVPRVIGRYSPVFVDHAQGIYVWDRDGRRYMDFTSGIAVVNTGHCHPRVVEAIRAQAGKIIHAQQNILLHEPMLDAAAELTATLPSSLDQVFWANSGAEAIEGALKLAKIATRRPAVIAMRGAFHGRTHAAMSVTSSRAKVRGHYEPLLASMYYAPYPYYFRSPFGSAPAEADDYYLSELKTLFDTMVMPDDVAAILVETVAGEGGYLVPSARWLQEVRSICDEHGIMLILDEIQTGMGRTGAMWGFEHFDVVPDIMTVAKGIASGLPVSAVVASKSTMDKWPPGAHGGTYGANAVGTAAAAETLRVMRDEHLPENAAEIGDMLMQGLRGIQAHHPVIGEVRGLGLMIAVEFVDQAGEPNAAAVSKVMATCLEENVLLINCGTYDQAIRVIPPLVIDRQQASEFLSIFERAVASI